MHTIGTPALWGGFTLLVLALLAIDLGLFQRKAHRIGFKEAAIWSAVWVSLSAAFNVFVWLRFGAVDALEFTTGYLIEKALAVDNLFVFAVIFGYFAVPARYQQRVLLWGILGALLMRAVFIGLGAALLARFHIVLYVFGGLLVLTGIRLVTQKEHGVDPEKNPVVRGFRRLVPMTDGFRDGHFTVVEKGRRLATPLLLVLVVIEASDVVFAIDSIPAIFAVTEDPFIVYTSNIFAILGLRSMYFMLAGVIDRFHLLKYGLAAVLVFVGAKMLLSDVVKIPIVLSLSVVVLLVGGAIAASLMLPRRESRRSDHDIDAHGGAQLKH
jgi:tellurite resistance protein TerC